MQKAVSRTSLAKSAVEFPLLLLVDVVIASVSERNQVSTDLLQYLGLATGVPFEAPTTLGRPGLQ